MTAAAAAQTPPPEVKPAAPPPKAAKPAKPAKKPAAAPAYKLVLEPKAMELLKATSARLAAAKSMTFTATVGYEFPSKLGPPIAYTMRYDVTMQRPDKLKIVMPGDGPASEFYYDGKTMMAYAPAENLVAVADAPPTIDAALMKAYTTTATFFPFTDLLVTDPYVALTEGAILAFYIGPSAVVGGVKTDMVAWANKDVFLQIWIGVEDKLPRRVRAMYAADPLAAAQRAGACELAARCGDRPGRVHVANGAGGPAHRLREADLRAAAGRQAVGQDVAVQGVAGETAIKVTMIGGLQ